MATITATMVNELRQKTNSGMMDCKKALSESDGDMEKAAELLRIKGQAAAAKRADRTATEGYVAVKLNADQSAAAMVQLNCETDFVARNESFTGLGDKLAALALAQKSDDLQSFLQATLDGVTVAEQLTKITATIGEKIEIGRVTYKQVSGGFIQPYIHPGARVGVLVQLEKATAAADQEVAKDLSMQIAAASPEYVGPEQVPADVKEKELNVIKEQLKEEGKPEAMLAKIAEGKINKFYTDICLLKQAFVKNPEISVEKHLATAAAHVKVAGFARFSIG